MNWSDLSIEMKIYVVTWILTLPLIPIVFVKSFRSVKERGIKNIQSLVLVFLSILVWFSPSIITAVYKLIKGEKLPLNFLVLFGTLFLISTVGFVRYRKRKSKEIK